MLWAGVISVTISEKGKMLSVGRSLKWSLDTSRDKMGKRGGGVPDRWEDYSNVGSVVEGTRFLAFKVPLKTALLSQVKPKPYADMSHNVTGTHFLGHTRGEERLGCFRPYNGMSHHLTGC